MARSGTAALNAALRDLRATGAAGFEGLVAHLLGRLTGHRFLLCASGRQEGRDMRAVTEFGTHIAVECKRYQGGTALDERELVAELAQAVKSTPHLDLWVLATSRSVPDQIEKTLRAQADEEGVAFVILDSLDDSIGTLAVLCAEFAADVLSKLPEALHEEVERGLNEVREDAGFATSIARLRQQFSSAWMGFDQSREESHSWLRSNLSDAAKSRSAFSQHLAVGREALPRPRLLNTLSAWFAKNESFKRPLVILGEEGDGKTWLAAYWLNCHLDDPSFPLVLFLQAALVTTTDVTALLSNALNRLSHGIGVERWCRRVERWTNSTEASVPTMVLILDGINEKFSSAHWRSLFANLESSDLRKHLRIVVTCRTIYWDRQFSGVFSRMYEKCPVPSFDDDELDAALKQKNMKRSDLSESILPLIRKPRYFDLAARHHEELAKSGDITVARLLYEDWSDRYYRHIHMPMSPADFNDWLKRVAEIGRAGERSVKPTMVSDEFPVLDDQARQELFAELVTGGVLSGSAGGRFEVDAQRLQMGFGLLLVDRVIAAERIQSSLSETISDWLEPAAGIDEKSRIVEHAALHALIDGGCSDKVCCALLAAWLGLQNRNDPECRNFIKYLPQRPSAFFRLAPELWTTPADNPWGQQLLLESILRWRDIDSVRQHAVTHAVEWLGYVFTYAHQDGRPKPDDPHEQFRLNNRAKLEENLAGHKPEGTLVLEPFRLIFINNEGLTRLGRLALAYMSRMPRKDFARALAVGMLAESVAPNLGKVDLMSWVMRTAQDSDQLRSRIHEAVRQLVGLRDFAPALSAAHRLLRSEGSAESLAELSKLPAEPPSAWQRRLEEHEKNPCMSFIRLTREQCISCLAKDDVQLLRLVDKAGSFWPDPDLPVPATFRDRMKALAPFVDTSCLWRERHFTPSESRLESIQPAFLACNAVLFSHRIRAIFLDAVNRTGDALWGLSLKVDNYGLLLDDATLSALRDCWAAIPERAPAEYQAQMEWTLFRAILPLWTAEEQLQRILARPSDAFDPRNCVFNYKPVPAGFCDAASIPEDVVSQRRAAWYLARSPEFADSRHFLHFLNHGDSFVRSIALKALYRFGSAAVCRDWLQAGWHHDPTMHPEESHWGSLILAKHEEVDPKEAMSRMHPAYAFDIGELRGWNEKAVLNLADYMSAWLAGVGATINVGAAQALPAMQVSNDLTAPPGHAFEFHINDIAPDRSVHFINSNSIWGGMFAQGSPDNKLFEQESAADWRKRVDQVYADADGAKRRGAHWLDRRVSVESAGRLLSALPTFAPGLIRLLEVQNPQTDQCIVEAYGLLTAICGCLLRSNPPAGAALYRRMKGRQTAVKQISGGTHLDWADEIAFKAPASDSVTAIWVEALDQCTSDGDLLTLCILANAGESRSWLERLVAIDFESEHPFNQARAVTLAGMMGIDAPTFAPDTWLEDVREDASQCRNRGTWAKTWFNRFLSSGTEEEAFAAFGLLLECVDRRFWTWQDELLSRSDTGISARRKAFMVENMGEFKKAVKDNEKPLFEHFLGTKVAQQQVWPWQLAM